MSETLTRGDEARLTPDRWQLEQEVVALRREEGTRLNAAREDPNELGRYVFRFPFGQHHVQLVQALQTHDRLIVEAPPRSGKTATLTHWFLWLIGRDPNIRILYVSSSDMQATVVSSLVKSTIEFRPEYRELFPDVRPDSDRGWADNEWFVKRPKPFKDPTFSAFGKGGPILTRGADVIVYESVRPHTARVNALHERNRQTGTIR